MGKVITADELREWRKARHSTVPITGTALEIEVRRLDILGLAVKGLLTLQQLGSIHSLLQRWEGLDAEALVASIDADLPQVAAAIDAVVCAAAVAPRVERERPAEDSGAIWIDELDLNTKLNVLRALGQLVSKSAADTVTSTPPAQKTVVDVEFSGA